MKPWIFIVALATSALGANPPRVITVGSKTFTESYILAEIIAQVIESVGEATVNRKYGLGGTGIVFSALAHGEIDIYPEYTGTIIESILGSRPLTSLKSQGIWMSASLGFNNTYALAVRKDFAKKYGLQKISDLTRVPNIRIGFSHEFMKRPDGYPGLLARYGLDLSNAKPLAHSLAYEAIRQNEIDLTDIYSTDAKIQKLDLLVLQDDKKLFPDYFAVLLARHELLNQFPKTWAALRSLENQIRAEKMIGLNGMADIDRKDFREIAETFLGKTAHQDNSEDWVTTFLKLTRQHFFLVGFSLLVAILLGLPLGILSTRFKFFGQAILTVSSLLQTIPSLALLCFLVPLFGIGLLSALVALLLYGLLPIVTGVYTGIKGIDPRLTESASALGLTPLQRLRFVDLPLASRSILAGIRMSAIIGIGTATLAALIGAGGYGVPIVTGLALNDMNMILTGAIPAALMALLAHLLFERLDRLLIRS